MNTIGERIKLRREELGLSQDELAKALGYKSRSSVNKIETDARNLTQSKIKAIADALDTTPSYIMGWEQEKPAAENGDELTDTEKQLLTLLRQLTPQQKDLLIGLMKQMLQKD